MGLYVYTKTNCDISMIIKEIVNSSILTSLRKVSFDHLSSILSINFEKPIKSQEKRILDKIVQKQEYLSPFTNKWV